MHATVLPRSTLKIKRVWVKRRKTLESDAISHSNKLRHPAHDDEQQQQVAALQLQQQQGSNTQSSSSSSSSRITLRVYTNTYYRTSYSSVQHNYNISGPGTLLWNDTRCLLIAKRDEKKTVHKIMEALRESNLRPHTLKECKLPSNYPFFPHTVPNKKRWKNGTSQKKQNNIRPHALKECRLPPNHRLSYTITCQNYLYLRTSRQFHFLTKENEKSTPGRESTQARPRLTPAESGETSKVRHVEETPHRVVDLISTY